MRIKNLKILHLLLILIHTITNSLLGQPKELQFKHITSDDGLSSSTIICIHQDYLGFLWIGTYDGLNKYDGNEFIIYKNNQEDPNSLTYNGVRTIYEDSKKNLFIGTFQGLCKYIREKDYFINFKVDENSPLKDTNCIISKIKEDSLSNLWLATSIGLMYFDCTNNTIDLYKNNPNDPESLSNNFVESILIDKKNRFWVSTRKGLNIFNPKTGKFKLITQLKNGKNIMNTYFTDMIEDQDGNIWIGSQTGLYCCKNSTNYDNIDIIHYQHDPNNDKSISTSWAKSFCIDDENNLWIGTDNGGVNLYDRENDCFWHYRIDEYNPKSLNNESVQAIYQDRTGNLWMGTFTGGLNMASKQSGAIISYKKLLGAPMGLSHNAVACFVEDYKGRLWLGTDGGGLNLFNPKTNRFTRYTKENSNISSNAIIDIIEDSDHTIWLGTWNGNLMSFNSDTRTFTSYTKENSGIPDNNIFAIEEGYDDDLWLGSFENGLIHYKKKEKKFTSYNTRNSGVVNDMIIVIKKDSKGRLFLGAINLFQIFNPEDVSFITYTHNPKDPNSLCHPNVRDILIQHDTCIWIATQEGLNRFNPETEKFIAYTTEDGLPDDVINGLVLDNDGFLWITTNKGVSRFDYINGEFKNFTKDDGLQSNEFLQRSILKTSEGVLFMGGIRGFNMIYPDKIVKNKIKPQILITGIHIFNQPVEIDGEDSPFTKHISVTDEIVLSYNQSVITLFYSAMDLTAPEKNEYKYMLENFDKHWIEAGNKREVTYTNLNPGEYLFKVIGSNNDGVWNNTGTSLKISILPPWYDTWVFKVLLIAVVIGIIVGFYLYRINNYKQQQRRLQILVDERTSEIRDKNEILNKSKQQIEEQAEELKTQRDELNERNKELNKLNITKDKLFSIIAHDLKNPFNSIMGYSDLLSISYDNFDDEKRKSIIATIKNSASIIFKLLENLLQWSRSQTDTIKYNPEDLSLNTIIDSNIELVRNLIYEKQLTLKAKLPKKIRVYADRNMLDVVFRKLLNNAIKFSDKGEIKIDIESSLEYIKVSISDTGKGIPEKELPTLFEIEKTSATSGTKGEPRTRLGLVICKEFIEKMGGEIGTESKEGKGSTFYFTIPTAKG